VHSDAAWNSDREQLSVSLDDAPTPAPRLRRRRPSRYLHNATMQTLLRRGLICTRCNIELYVGEVHTEHPWYDPGSERFAEINARIQKRLPVNARALVIKQTPTTRLTPLSVPEGT